MLLTGLCLTLSGCGYSRPAGQWQTINASAIYFPGVTLSEKAIDPSYTAVCQEAKDEITTQLNKALSEKIAPLPLIPGTPAQAQAAAAVLSIQIRRCEIDVEQSGGSFSYYLSLPVTISLTQNGRPLLRYSMNTYEQISVDQPGPEFEFTFDEPVARTLLLFDGNRLWLPAD